MKAALGLKTSIEAAPAVARHLIMIVEDDENVGGLLRVMFARQNFAPVLLRDGRAAEEYVAAHDPVAAIVLDGSLPYRDGFAVAETVRANARWSTVPIVMVTGRHGDADVDRARACGVEHYVVKPFKPSDLAKLVRNVAAVQP